MEQLAFPNVENDADNQEAKRRFLEDLEADRIEVNFPKETVEESLAYLKFFTKDNPEHSFMFFETARDGHRSPHLVKVEVPYAGYPSDHNQEIENYARTLVSEVSKFRRPLEKFFVFNRGDVYAAKNISQNPRDVEFDGFGFLEV